MRSSQKILVTGADGFIGSHLCEELVRSGFRVKALVFYNSNNLCGWLDYSPLKKDMEIISGDIRDSFLMEEILHDVDFIFHLAALIAIPYSYKAPLSYFETNVGGTLNLLEAARKKGVSRFLHMSTSEVYGTAKHVPISETHILQPQSPYSASKIGAESAALSFYHSFDLPVIVARTFNTYGPRQSMRAVIPSIFAQLYQGINEIFLGNLTPTRDFNFVMDTVKNLIRLMGVKEAVGEVVNIGSGIEISIQNLVSLQLQVSGKTSVTVRSEAARVRKEGSEVKRLCCDSSKYLLLCKKLDHTPLEEGLKSTWEWFLSLEYPKGFLSSGYVI